MAKYLWHFRGGRILVAVDLTDHLKGPDGALKGTSKKYVREGLADHLRKHGYTVDGPPECICYSTRDPRCQAHDPKEEQNNDDDC